VVAIDAGEVRALAAAAEVESRHLTHHRVLVE
jgi:hypothetical protein